MTIPISVHDSDIRVWATGTGIHVAHADGEAPGHYTTGELLPGDDLPDVDETPTCNAEELLDWLCWATASTAQRFYPPDETALECCEALHPERSEYGEMYEKEYGMHIRALNDAEQFYRHLENRGYDPKARAEREIERSRGRGLEGLESIDWEWYEAADLPDLRFRGGECDHCGDEYEDYPTVDQRTGEAFCSISCAMANDTGRPREDFEYDDAQGSE